MASCLLVVSSCSIMTMKGLFESGAFDSKTELAVRNISNCTLVRLPPGSTVLRAETDEPSFTGDFSGHFVADVPSRAVEKMRTDAKLPNFTQGIPDWGTPPQRWPESSLMYENPPDPSAHSYSEGVNFTVVLRAMPHETTRVYVGVTCF